MGGKKMACVGGRGRKPKKSTAIPAPLKKKPASPVQVKKKPIPKVNKKKT